MKKLTIAMILAGSTLLASTASAQEPLKQFYDIEEMLVDGEIRVPKVYIFDKNQRAKFERLMSLKRSFLPKIQETTAQPAFR